MNFFSNRVALSAIALASALSMQNASADQVFINGQRAEDPAQALAYIKQLEAETLWEFEVPAELAGVFVEGFDKNLGSKLFSDPLYFEKGFVTKEGCGKGIAMTDAGTFSYNDPATWWQGADVQRCATPQKLTIKCLTTDCANGVAVKSALIYQIRPTGRRILWTSPISGKLVPFAAKERQHDTFLDAMTFGYGGGG